MAGVEPRVTFARFGSGEVRWAKAACGSRLSELAALGFTPADLAKRIERGLLRFDQGVGSDDLERLMKAGMPSRRRRCLRCATIFLSAWAGNRHCQACNNWLRQNGGGDFAE